MGLYVRTRVENTHTAAASAELTSPVYPHPNTSVGVGCRAISTWPSSSARPGCGSGVAARSPPSSLRPASSSRPSHEVTKAVEEILNRKMKVETSFAECLAGARGSTRRRARAVHLEHGLDEQLGGRVGLVRVLGVGAGLASG